MQEQREEIQYSELSISDRYQISFRQDNELVERLHKAIEKVKNGERDDRRPSSTPQDLGRD